MRWLLRLLSGFFQWPADDRAISSSEGDETGTTTEADDRDQMLSGLQQTGGFRRVTRHVLGPPASSDGVGWSEEHIEYMDGDLVQTVVEETVPRRCSCGAFLGYGTNVLGICSVCNAVLCSAEGCAGTCSYCGGLCCRRHRVEIAGRTYCTRHRWVGYWQAFWEGVK